MRFDRLVEAVAHPIASWPTSTAGPGRSRTTGSSRTLATSSPVRARRRFLARWWELAARHGVRGVVSLSDPVPRRTVAGELVFPGHVGTIYQASNAAYLGRTTPFWRNVRSSRNVYLATDEMRGDR